MNVLHSDCVCCRARTMSHTDPAPNNAEHATEVLLAMLFAGITFDQILHDLCFLHRRHVEEAAQAIVTSSSTS